MTPATGLAMHVAKNPPRVHSLCLLLHLHLMHLTTGHFVAARQPSVCSKLTAASTAKATASDCVWSEGRKVLPTVAQEYHALCGCEFTLNAAANADGDNTLCTNFCSPS